MLKNPAEPARRYTAEELRALPTLLVGQADDLKISNELEEVWLSRMTVEDGAPYNDEISHAFNAFGVWLNRQYQG